MNKTMKRTYITPIASVIELMSTETLVTMSGGSDTGIKYGGSAQKPQDNNNMQYGDYFGGGGFANSN